MVMSFWYTFSGVFLFWQWLYFLKSFYINGNLVEIHLSFSYLTYSPPLPRACVFDL